MKRLVVLSLLFCMASLIVGSLNVPSVKAVPVTVTRTFTSLTYDGEIEKVGTNYTTIWIASTGSVDATTTIAYIGQWYDVPGYEIWRSFFFFDTSIIPNDAVLTQAKLSFFIVDVRIALDNFSLVIQNGQPIYPHVPLQSGDYNKEWYSGNGGNRSAFSFGLDIYENITLNAQGLSWINNVGTTKLCLRSSRDISGSTPQSDEYASVYCAERGQNRLPKLYVTYTTEGYNYVVHGPYYEDGSVATQLVKLKLEIENMASQTYTLNGTDGVADTLNITVEQKGIVFTWNFSGYGNTTRTFYLTSASFEEIWIYLPSPDDPCYLYTFTVNDFVGVTNAYLETVINVAGQSRIVERQSLAVISSLPFWLTWAKRYDVRLICDQGSYTWGGFIPLTEQDQNLIITVGMFPITYPGLHVTVRAKRMNGTWIQINYTDSQALTSWVRIDIQYRKGSNWYTAYTYGPQADNTHQVNWYLANNKTNYVVKVTALRDDQQKTWNIGCPKPSVEESPWGGLKGLGEWPIPPETVIGLFLVLCVFGVCSYRTLALGCISACILASFFTYIGWLPCPWPLLGLAWAISIFVAIAEAKKEEREI